MRMLVKDDEEVETSSQKSSGDHDVPLYSSLESLLIIPPSMSRELSEKALETQLLLDKWSNNRRQMVRSLEKIAEKLNNWEKGCAISTTVGSSVGITSGLAVIGGLFLMPPVAIAGLIVGTAAGVSNLATGVTKTVVTKSLSGEVRKLIEEDERLFGQLMKSREELLSAVRRILSDEEFLKSFSDNTDVANKLKSVLGFSVTGITGLGTKFAVTQMGRLSSSMVKGVLHSVAVIGIVIDSVTLAMSVNTLSNGAGSEFGAEILHLSSKMEMCRQKVVKHFLNQDVWDVDDDLFSDVGHAELDSPFESMSRPIASAAERIE